MTGYSTVSIQRISSCAVYTLWYFVTLISWKPSTLIFRVKIKPAIIFPFVDSEAWKSSFPVDVDEAKCEQNDSPIVCRVRVAENHG